MKTFMKTPSVLIMLVSFSLQTGIILSYDKNFIHFVFFLIYVGAILVLIVYLFFSSFKVSFSNFSSSLVLLSVLFIFFQTFKTKMISFEYEELFYTGKESSFMLCLCMYIMLVLLSILKLDLFRFSSLRKLY